MKYLILPILIATISLTACSNEGTGDNNGATTTGTTETTHGSDDGHNHGTAATGPVDPVCEMAVDPTWTSYSVHAGDTVKFCSEGCKSAFDARPEKYAANIRK